MKTRLEFEIQILENFELQMHVVDARNLDGLCSPELEPLADFGKLT